jgi:hypothetical protein
MAKQLKVTKVCSIHKAPLDLIPQEIFVGHILPFLDEVGAYCLHMTCRRFRGVYRHLRPWDDKLKDLPYPLWAFVRLKWCPACHEPYNGTRIDKCYGHTRCKGWYQYSAKYPASGDSQPGLHVVGPPYNFGVVNAAVTRRDYFGDLEGDDVRRSKTLEILLFDLQLAKHYNDVKASDNKIQLAPGVHINYFKVRERDACSCHDCMEFANLKTWTPALRRARHTAKTMWDWWKKTIRPKFVWDDPNEWHETMAYIVTERIRDYFLSGMDMMGNDGKIFIPAAYYIFDRLWHLHEFQADIMRKLPHYINRRLAEHTVAVCSEDLDNVRCNCSDCTELTRDLTRALTHQLSKDNVAMGTSIKGVGDVLRFGDLIHKSPEIHREFICAVSRAVIATYKLVKVFHENNTGTSRRDTTAAMMNIAYKYVLGDHKVDEYEKEMTSALRRYSLLDVVEAFRNGGPGNILATARDYKYKIKST